MNIFVLDYSPVLAAKYHHDKHVLKMILESAQLLSGAHHVVDPGSVDREDFKGVTYYKDGRYKIYAPTHLNHPCAKWAQASGPNYKWLWNLAYNLCWEYRNRFKKIHATEEILRRGLRKAPQYGGKFTSFVQVMPDEFKSGDPVEAYRNYYRKVKAAGQKWTGQQKPAFLTQL